MDVLKYYMQRNIKLLYGLRFVRAFTVVVAVFVPFFQENGLSQTQIFVLQSIFAVAVLVLEIPSGYFADSIGRRRSLLIGGFLMSGGFMVYSLAFSFWPMALAEIILGFGFSFISGADDALAYDSLKVINKTEGYKAFEARSNALIGFSEAGASLLGGALALITLRTPVFAQIFIEALSIPLVLLMREPPRTKMVADNPLKDAFRVSKYALHDHAEVKWLILYGAMAGTLTHTMVWLTQPYYQLVGVPLGWFGVLWATQLVAMAVFSHYSVAYERWLGKRRALISFPIIGVVTYLVVAAFPILPILPVLLGFYFVRGVHIPILKHYVNELVESDIRATILSVKNFAQKLLYAGLGPLVGVVVDAYSLRTALFFSAGIYGFLALVVVLNMRRLKLL